MLYSAALLLLVIFHAVNGDAANEAMKLAATGVIAGYGDFNSDRTTDVFVISNGWKQLDLYVWLTAKQQFSQLHTVKVKTNGPESIKGISLADFDGDSNMDVLLVTTTEKTQDVLVTVYYGDKSTLTKGGWSTKMLDHPSVIDANGDLLPDLFGISADKAIRSYWMSIPAGSGSTAHFTQNSQPQVSSKLVIPQSNAFVDVTGDKHPDLVIRSTSEETPTTMLFETWVQKPGHYNLSLSDTLPFDIADVKHIGQMSFADLDGDGVIDLLLPVCLTDDCARSVLYHRSPKGNSLMNGTWSVVLDNLNADWMFPLERMEGNSQFPFTIIHGDFLLDGNIDAVAILQKKDGSTLFPATLVNVLCSDSNKAKTTCELLRTYQVRSLKYTRGNPFMISLMDVRENGVLNFMLSWHDADSKIYYTEILRNEFNVDTAFLKVAVVTGNSKGSIPYGANQIGSMIDISTTNTDGHKMVSQAVQQCQSSHFSLQLPYVIFGLGKSPNFVEEIKVGIPKGPQLVDRVRSWLAIIPNAQVIVVIYPKDSPVNWTTKLLVAPGKLFLQTGGVLLGTCLLIAGVILILHVKEKREDEREKRQDAHKFHFDAL